MIFLNKEEREIAKKCATATFIGGLDYYPSGITISIYFGDEFIQLSDGHINVKINIEGIVGVYQTTESEIENYYTIEEKGHPLRVLISAGLGACLFGPVGLILGGLNKGKTRQEMVYHSEKKTDTITIISFEDNGELNAFSLLNVTKNKLVKELENNIKSRPNILIEL